ncbi:unnamed protein product [Spirodela intermedia]|uniref:RING-type E3 ubiquitin transferase n=1 Tax=Spirodela intermedia TaxID=51605 RepID=A0A7I8KE10_SPIIN|nr:unnamed protein product [Spirodela intermedia]
MVSVAESQVPSRQLAAGDKSGRMQRQPGRSMRTFRPNLFRAEAHSCSFDGSEAFASPAGGRSTSASVSENLTDSVVDFRLRELAGKMASSSNPGLGIASELLELSQDFSDVSSFNSDISGELQRLASLGVASPQREGGAGAAREDPEMSRVRRRQREGSSGAAVPSFTSGEICDKVVALEELELAVRSCVETLESSSSSSSLESKCSAAGKLRLLAKHRSDFRAVIGGCPGAISSLVGLLRSADPATQENAATALLNLSLEESNQARITAAGAIKPLVYALKTGTEAAKQNAACALLSLSMIEDNRATIGACGAIPPLVSLLLHGSSRGKKDSLTTLYKLCTTQQNKERAVTAGAVRPLVELVVDHGAGTTEKAMVVLNSLAGIPEGREAIVDEGGIPALVEAIEDGSVKGKEFAVAALLQLCSDCTANRHLLVREGAIPPLVALSQCGTARAKHKAETLLAYLRELRHEGTPPAISPATPTRPR